MALFCFLMKVTSGGARLLMTRVPEEGVERGGNEIPGMLYEAGVTTLSMTTFPQLHEPTRYRIIR